MIFGVTSCITPLPLDLNGIGVFNLAAMGATAAALILFMILGKNTLKRPYGVILLLMYIAFMVCNCRAAIGA